MREHLRACAHCRATMRTYRAAPRIAVALLPALPPSRSLLERAQDLAANLSSRLPGFGSSESVATQVAAAGGTRGAGMAALAKLLTVCAGAAGGAAACVATGVLPAPVLVPDPAPKPAIERPATSASTRRAKTRRSTTSRRRRRPKPRRASRAPSPRQRRRKPTRSAPNRALLPAGAVEYEAPAPAPEPAASSEAASASSSSGSAAGEFGP